MESKGTKINEDLSSLTLESTKINIISSLTLEPQRKQPEHKPSICCLKCDIVFQFPTQKDDYLAHLYLVHRLIIADVEDISNLSEYLKYWLTAFKGYELEEFCTTMLLDQLPDGTFAKNEKYYLLCDILPQDYELRKRLHGERLQSVLTQHQFERTDRTFSRECLHCRDVITGLRSEFLEHLFVKHFVQLGKAENLVYVDELIDNVQSKLENLICLYCEKIFKDRGTLKEHMRKKGHKRINPDLKFYDKFFLVNYKNEKPIHVKKFKTNRQNEQKHDYSFNNNQNPSTSTRKNSEMIFNNEENNQKLSDDNDSDWSDWDGEQQSLTCLYCSQKDIELAVLKNHMLVEHGVNFDEDTKALNFYQKIKVVNYVRRQMHILRCIACNQSYENLIELQTHMKEMKHFGIGEKKQWDQPEFFFPTYEDDGLLYILDNDNDQIEDSPVLIYSEDSKANINLDAEKLSIENFVL